MLQHILQHIACASGETAAKVTASLDAATTAVADSERFEKMASTISTSGFLLKRTEQNALCLAIVFAGFMLHLAFEFWKEDKLQWRPHVVRYFVFTVLVLGYQPLAQTISGFVLSLGAINTAKASAGNEETVSFLAEQKLKFDDAKATVEDQIADADARAAAKKPKPTAAIEAGFDERGSPSEVNSAVESTGTSAGFGERIVNGIDNALSSLLFHAMRLVVEASFTFAAVALTFLKMLQATMLKIILALGPFMIAFSSWPGMTSRYITSWASALIEVSAWGLAANALIAAMVGNVKASGGDVADPNFFVYLGQNVLYAASLLSVPAITSSILRGSAASGITAAGMWAAGVGAAGSAARMAANGARRTPKGNNKSSPNEPGGSGSTPSSSSEPSTGASDKPSDRAFHAKRASIAAQQKEKS